MSTVSNTFQAAYKNKVPFYPPTSGAPSLTVSSSHTETFHNPRRLLLFGQGVDFKKKLKKSQSFHRAGRVSVRRARLPLNSSAIVVPRAGIYDVTANISFVLR